MFKGFSIGFLYLISLTIFSQNSRAFASKIDSCLYYNETAIYNKNHKIFDKALENANKSIVYGLKNKNTASVANGYFTLAIIYIDLKRYNDAIEKLIRSVSILNTAEPSAKLGLCYYNLGLCYMQKKILHEQNLILKNQFQCMKVSI